MRGSAISSAGQSVGLRSRRLARASAWQDDRCAACGSEVVWAPFARGGSVALHPYPSPSGKYCLPLSDARRAVHDVRPTESQPSYSLRYAAHFAVCSAVRR